MRCICFYNNINILLVVSPPGEARIGPSRALQESNQPRVLAPRASPRTAAKLEGGPRGPPSHGPSAMGPEGPEGGRAGPSEPKRCSAPHAGIAPQRATPGDSARWHRTHFGRPPQALADLGALVSLPDNLPGRRLQDPLRVTSGRKAPQGRIRGARTHRGWRNPQGPSPPATPC